MSGSVDDVLTRLAQGREERLRHVEVRPARSAVHAPWPDWVSPEIRESFPGINQPWLHQVQAAEIAHSGQHVVLATGTASGKSLAYSMPILTSIQAGLTAANGRGATALYIAPTKALAHDQLRTFAERELPWLRAATVDGDNSREERTWAQNHANLILTNPDLLHHSMLGNHERWAPFLKKLQYIVIDEAHVYRGVFGAHVSAVIRRLRRICVHLGSDPIVIAASATVADPAIALERLIGDSVREITEDAAPTPERTIALWQPLDLNGPETTHRTATTEAAHLLADLVADGRQTLAFVRSRRAAEGVAALTRDLLRDIDPELVQTVASYRGGYLPEERRALESSLREGHIRALATTNALELGIDISGLDAVVIAGWPGTRASLWQQFGRAGRGDAPALAIFIAREDPLDAFVVEHPSSILDAPVEASVFDPTNPVILGPHLCAAASELPLTDADAERWFGTNALPLLADLAEQGFLRKRASGWFWTRRERASDLADLRSTGGAPIRIVEQETGRLLGTIDQASSHSTVHPGAVYAHQGVISLVTDLDLDESVATVIEEVVDYTTIAHEVSEIRIMRTSQSKTWGAATVNVGQVQVTSQVLSFQKRRVLTGENLGEQGLDLPERELITTAVWWTITDDQCAAASVELTEVPGAVHAAEHASIALLPLFATCDRWDIGGVSTALHIDTGQTTVFVYDGYPGGAGFAQHGFDIARTWLTATRDLIRECRCRDGCPSCVQSPKCGNGNHPLDKLAAIRILTEILRGADNAS
ncbi:MAG: DEAD/DEAH box helicase [Actinomycetota bacterium]|nr:DEAD/DEAH box helicase [Actinomycetota bacterium]MDP2287577.1 DEAD/DEAH box helicase [Actinomycetota bacterium]